MLLKVGRHIRPKPEFKLIIARDAGESKYLEGYRKQFVTIQIVSHNGPLTMVDGDIKPEDFELAAGVVARYGQGREAEQVEVHISVPGQDVKIMNIKPLTVEQVNEEWHV
ncbi:MAG TPA: hypothetical protein ENH74_08110 [Methylophaga sp.]|nr:hypothetical protein [Methylophaga sp.]